jgi:hypothetical protein
MVRDGMGWDGMGWDAMGWESVQYWRPAPWAGSAAITAPSLAPARPGVSATSQGGGSAVLDSDAVALRHRPTELPKPVEGYGKPWRAGEAVRRSWKLLRVLHRVVVWGCGCLCPYAQRFADPSEVLRAQGAPAASRKQSKTRLLGSQRGIALALAIRSLAESGPSA